MASSTAARERLNKAFEDASSQIASNTATAIAVPDKNNSESDMLNAKGSDADLSKTNGAAVSAAAATASASRAAEPELVKHLSRGWGNVMEATKQTISATRKVIEDEITHFNTGSGKFQERDLALPLDSVALRDTEVIYITDRLISMGHPAVQSENNLELTPARKLAAVSHLFKKRHGDRYMIWNLSELEYDTAVMDDQVLTFKFPGSPAPPLGLIIRILLSIESWLQADPRNVAILHCLTGKGRTSCVLAAFLCWTGECGFHTTTEALVYIAACKRCPLEALTIPSQRRYLTYFSNMLDGIRPHRPPVILKRVVMNLAPSMEQVPISKAVGLVVSDDSPTFEPLPTVGNDGKATSDDENATKVNESPVDMVGCAPYLQIFKGGRLLFTTCTTSSKNRTNNDEIPWCVSRTGGAQQRSFTFAVDAVVQGDILLRCRHMTDRGQRVSMFRIALHSGYIVAPKVLRLSKSDIDGACHDDRFPEDFYLDLVFDVCDADTASKLLRDDEESETSQAADKGSLKASESSVVTTDNSEMSTAKALKPSVITPKTSYDSMLFGDSRLWDSIAKRKERISTVSKLSIKTGEKLVGLTIGRKRDLSKLKTRDEESKNNDSKALDVKRKKSPAPIDSFSIGDNFGFMDIDEPTEIITPKPPTRKPDSLMEALMAIEHGSPDAQKHKASASKVDDAKPEIEEIVFDRGNYTETNLHGAEYAKSADSPVGDECQEDTKSDELDVLNAANKVNEGEVNDEDVENDIDDFDFDQLGDNLDLDDDDDDDQSLDDLEEFLTRT